MRLEFDPRDFPNVMNVLLSPTDQQGTHKWTKLAGSRPHVASTVQQHARVAYQYTDHAV